MGCSENKRVQLIIFCIHLRYSRKCYLVNVVYQYIITILVLKHTYQLLGMAITLRMRTTISLQSNCWRPFQEAVDFYCRVIIVLVRVYTRKSTRQWKSTLKQVHGKTELTASVGKVNIYEKTTTCAPLVRLGQMVLL